MFEAELKDKVQRIFGTKVSFTLPGESQEQECIFIDVQSALNFIKKGKEISTVRGTLLMYANSDKMPFGFYSKKIMLADPSLTKNFYFYNMDGNSKTIQNIVERRCDFVFLYSNEYDPNGGSLTSVDFDEGA